MAKATTVSKADLVDKIATTTKLSKKTVKETVDALLESMSADISEGSKVTLTGFGTFELRERKPRTGVKPGTTEKIEIPASRYPAFKAGKSLKDKVANRR